MSYNVVRCCCNWTHGFNGGVNIPHDVVCCCNCRTAREFACPTTYHIGRHQLCRPMSSDIVRQGIQHCRTMMCAVWTLLKAQIKLNSLIIFLKPFDNKSIYTNRNLSPKIFCNKCDDQWPLMTVIIHVYNRQIWHRIILQLNMLSTTSLGKLLQQVWFMQIFL